MPTYKERWRTKFVFFDHGGTLAYSQRDTPEIVLEMLSERGYSYTRDRVISAYESAEDYWREQLEPLLASTPRGQRTKYFLDYHRFLLNQLGVRDSVDEVARQIDEEWHDRAEITLYSDTIPCLEELKRRQIPMGVITQTLRTVVEFVEYQLKIEGIDHYFAVILTSEAAGYDKPDPRLFLRAAQLAGHPPNEIMHVGDRYEWDVQGAKAAGMRALLIDRTGEESRSGCENLSTLIELPKLLKDSR